MFETEFTKDEVYLFPTLSIFFLKKVHFLDLG